MAVTVSLDLTTIYDAEATTNWNTDGDTIAVHSGFQREGTNNLGFQVSQGTGHAWKTIASTDLSTTRIYSWMAAFNNPETKANGGFRIVLGDGTNRVAYFVGGSDDFGFDVGLWNCLVLDTGNLSGMGSSVLAGTLAGLEGNLAAITEVGVGFNFTAKALGNVDNAFWDICRFGNGLIIAGGTSADPGTFSEIATDDASTAAGKAYGIVREIQSGVFGIQGNLTFGDNTGTSDFFFKDQNAVVVIEDHIHGTGTPTAISITVVGNNTATTQHFELGVPVGTGDDERGRNGVTFRNANLTQRLFFDSSDFHLDDFLMFGGGFDGFEHAGIVNSLKFSGDATLGPTHRLSGVSFSRCGPIDFGRVVVRNCSISGHSGTDAAILWNESIDIKNCSFIANTDATNDPAGIEHPSSVGSPYTYDNLTFSGNDFDIFNNSGASITIDAINGANPVTSKGDPVTINNAVTLKVTVKDEAGVAIESAQAAIFRTDDGTELMNQLTDVNGIAQTTFNYSVDVDVSIRVRKSSTGVRYFPVNSPAVITSDGLNVVITLIEDTIAV